MKKLLLTCAFLSSSPVWAQQAPAAQLELPHASPFAKSEQTVGLTDITVDYSSPGVKGRKIWGELVPYAQVWRTGANKATKITFSKDVTVGTTAVPAGSYAFFAIPTADSWTLILNKDFNQGGAFNYKKELDVVRVEAKPEAVTMRERLAYTISDFSDDQANISLEWEKVRVSLPVKLATEAQVATNLKTIDTTSWQAANNAAHYFLGVKSYDTAISWADKSIKLKETWGNDWTKAEALAGKGKNKDAVALAEKVQKLGAKDKDFGGMGDEVKKSIADWKTKK